jgi:hypothetical protein
MTASAHKLSILGIQPLGLSLVRIADPVTRREPRLEIILRSFQLGFLDVWAWEEYQSCAQLQAPCVVIRSLLVARKREAPYNWGKFVEAELLIRCRSSAA